jgi:outer membrane receptor protein involved in Fe transport
MLTLIRTTAKATISHYRRGVLPADLEWKIGTQIERGEHDQAQVIPGGTRFIDNGGQPLQAISAAPSTSGDEFITVAAFASDTVRTGDRLTINLGVRFDHSRAISQDLD